MKKTYRRTAVLIAFTVLFVLALLFHYVKLGFEGSKYVSFPANWHLYTDGRLVRAGAILDRNGNSLAETNDGVRKFSSDSEIRRATAHIVGDLEGNVATGIHSVYFNEITGYNVFDGVYNTTDEGNDITLTIDVDVSLAAYRALGNRKGTVGVMNWQTGDLLCAVSTPTFDPEDVDSVEDDMEKGVFVNRLLSGQYAPGSIFKLVTALSALENDSDIKSKKYSCEAGVTIDEEWLSCMSNHGKLDIERALVKSCNASFAQMAIQLGKNKLSETAEEVGFNKEIGLGKIPTAKSIIDFTNINQIDLGWAGIGQHTDLVNPYQYLTFVSAIANGGVLKTPNVVKQITSPTGVTLKKGEEGNEKLFEKGDAAELAKMMRKVMTDSLSDSGFSGLEVCAKTGTAEIGEDEEPHAWFVGFCQNEDYPYAFVVIVEHGGMGAGAAKSVASQVLAAVK